MDKDDTIEDNIVYETKEVMGTFTQQSNYFVASDNFNSIFYQIFRYDSLD